MPYFPHWKSLIQTNYFYLPDRGILPEILQNMDFSLNIPYNIANLHAYILKIIGDEREHHVYTFSLL